MIIKYTNCKHVDDMINLGKVHLGSFWAFRRDERDEIDDPDEGEAGFILFNNTDEPWVVSPETLDAAALSPANHPRFTEPLEIAPGDESLFIGAGGFNTYLYCLTIAESPSRKLMSELGYDCAVEVLCEEPNKPMEFSHHLAKAAHQVLDETAGVKARGFTNYSIEALPVRYVEAKRTLITPATEHDLFVLKKQPLNKHALFTKTKHFEYQSEFRIVLTYHRKGHPEDPLPIEPTLGGSNAPLAVTVGDFGDGRIGKLLRRIPDSEFID